MSTTKLYLGEKLLLQSGKGTTGERDAVAEVLVHISGLRPQALRLEYLHGSGTAGIDLTWQAPTQVLRAEAVAIAQNTDVIVAFVGLSPSLEGEEMPVQLPGFAGGDRTSPFPPKAGCVQGAPNFNASRTPVQDSGGTGARQRNSPTGGSANGIPTNDSVPPPMALPRRVPWPTRTRGPSSAKVFGVNKRVNTPNKLSELKRCLNLFLPLR